MNAHGGHQHCHSMDHQVIMTNEPGFLGLPVTDTQVNMNEHRREFIKSHHLKKNIKVVKYSGIPVYPSPSPHLSPLLTFVVASWPSRLPPCSGKIGHCDCQLQVYRHLWVVAGRKMWDLSLNSSGEKVLARSLIASACVTFFPWTNHCDQRNINFSWPRS